MRLRKVHRDHRPWRDLGGREERPVRPGNAQEDPAVLAERSGFESNLPNKSGEIRFPDVSLELPSRVEQTASKIGRRGNSGADNSIVTGQRRNLFGTPPNSAKLSSAAEVHAANAVCSESSRTVAGALAFHGV